MQMFHYFVNINERDEFNADVRTDCGETVFEILNIAHAEELVDDGYLLHVYDIKSLTEYLQDQLVIGEDDQIVCDNFNPIGFRSRLSHWASH